MKPITSKLKKIHYNSERLILLSLFRRIANTESYTLGGLYPDTLYYIWLAARSQKGK